MAFKFISFFAILAVASAGTIYQAPTTVLHRYQPAAYAAYATPFAFAAPASTTFLRTPLVASETPIITKKLEEIDPHVSYSFGYDVKDSITGDFKNHQERREGDLVQGQYSLLDADGYKRTVDYTADSINGFNAHVSRDPILTKTIIAEPIIKAALPTLVKSIEPAIVKTAEPTLIKAAEPTLIKTIQPTLINVAAPSIYTATHLPYANQAYIKSGYGAFDYGYGYNGYPLYPQTYFVPTLRAASSSITAPISEVATAAVAAPVVAPEAPVAAAVEVN